MKKIAIVAIYYNFIFWIEEKWIKKEKIVNKLPRLKLCDKINLIKRYLYKILITRMFEKLKNRAPYNILKIETLKLKPFSQW